MSRQALRSLLSSSYKNQGAQVQQELGQVGPAQVTPGVAAEQGGRRGLAVFLLLNALSMPGSFVLALAFLVASAASAALPIAPAGAATQAGAGAAILVLSGVNTSHAVAFSIAAQALVIVTGAAVILLVAAWQLALRFRRLRVVPAA